MVDIIAYTSSLIIYELDRNTDATMPTLAESAMHDRIQASFPIS